MLIQGYGLQVSIFALTELHPLCNLKPISATIPITQFDFGGLPYSDTCYNVPLYCILDDSLTSTTMWIVSNTGGVLFYLTADPLYLSDAQNNYYPDSIVTLTLHFNKIYLFVLFCFLLNFSWFQ